MFNKEKYALYHELEKRVLAGENKSDIYNQYLTTDEGTTVARILARIAAPDLRIQNTTLNSILLFLLVTLFLINGIFWILDIFTDPLSLGLLYLYAIWYLRQFSCIAYLISLLVSSLTVLTSLALALKVVLLSPEIQDSLFLLVLSSISSILGITSIVMSIALKKNLFPFSSFFLSFPMRENNGAGRAIFGDEVDDLN